MSLSITKDATYGHKVSYVSDFRNRGRGVPYPKLVDYFEKIVEKNPTQFKNPKQIEDLIKKRFQNRGTKIASQYVFKKDVLGNMTAITKEEIEEQLVITNPTKQTVKEIRRIIRTHRIIKTPSQRIYLVRYNSVTGNVIETRQIR